MRALLLALLLAVPAAAQSWTLLSKRMPNGFAERTYTQMQSQFDSCAIIYQGYEAGVYNTSIYSNFIARGCLNAAADSIIFDSLKVHKWRNANSGSPYRTVMLSSNLTGDSTPPDAHRYFGVKADTVYIFGGLHASAGIQDTITFQSANVNTGTDVITLDRALKWFGTRDAVQLTGTPPSPLVAGTVYFLIRVTPSSIQLATTSQNAAAGTAIDLTTQATSSIYHALNDNWHPSDMWDFSTTSRTYTQRHDAPTYARGTSGFGQATVWWPPKNTFLIQRLRNYELTAEYAWKYAPSSRSWTQLTSGGNARNDGEAPNVGGANSMTYVGADSCVYYFGDIADTAMGAPSFEGFGNRVYRMCASEVWSLLSTPSPAPIQRDNCVFEWIPGTTKCLMFGGNTRIPGNTARNLNDTWIYDTSNNTWDSLEVGTLPTAGVQAYGTYLKKKRKMLIQVLVPGGGTNFYTMPIRPVATNPMGMFPIMEGF